MQSKAVHQELVLRLDVESDIMARNSVKPLSRKIDCSDELCGAGYQSFFDEMAWFRLRAQQAVAGVEILGEVGHTLPISRIAVDAGGVKYGRNPKPPNPQQTPHPQNPEP